MNLLKKTPAGTIGAYSYEQEGNPGIAIGFLNKTSHTIVGSVFLEVDADGNADAIIKTETSQQRIRINSVKPE